MKSTIAISVILLLASFVMLAANLVWPFVGTASLACAIAATLIDDKTNATKN